MADDRWLVCPFCGMSRKLIKSGTEAKKPLSEVKGVPRFDVVNPKDSPFIDIRDVSGGRGSGFPRIDYKSLESVLDDPEYADLIEQLYSHCTTILAVLKNTDKR